MYLDGETEKAKGLYRQILDVQGVVFDFGTRWGQNAALFTSFRGIYEPFNRHRRIVGFDTFEGFRGVAAEDGEGQRSRDGDFSVTPGYEQELAADIDVRDELKNILKADAKSPAVVSPWVSAPARWVLCSGQTVRGTSRWRRPGSWPSSWPTSCRAW